VRFIIIVLIFYIIFLGIGAILFLTLNDSLYIKSSKVNKSVFLLSCSCVSFFIICENTKNDSLV